MFWLRPHIALRAYAQGLFPMARSRDDHDFYWIDPPKRGILPLDDFHIPRRLARTMRQNIYDIHYDRDFPAVVRACSRPRTNQPDTWLNEAIIDMHVGLHQLGQAHSVECWQNARLVGGLYGISLGGVFFGESMFSYAPDASKIALCYLVESLLAGGYVLLDVQYMSDHLRQFGACDIPRKDYKRRLQSALLVSSAEFQASPPLSMITVQKPNVVYRMVKRR